MPRVEFVESNIKKNEYDYPKFKLEKKGEVARVAVLEAPVAEFVHNLQKPKIVGGVAQRETKKTKAGEEYETYVWDFVGRPLCLGDYGVLTENGVDPDKCPLCAEAVRGDRIKAPVRRFALHLIRYETNAQNVVKEPFSARTEVYSFTDKVFEELFALKQQGFDLLKHDLIFKAENPAFAGYNITPAADAEWLKTEERRNYIKGLLQPENLASDLAIFCGSRKTEKQIGFDIAAINEAWDIATGVRQVSATDAALSSVGASGGLVGDLNDFLSGDDAKSVDATAPEVEEWATPAADAEPMGFEDLAEAAKSGGSGDGDGDPSLEDLLSGL